MIVYRILDKDEKPTTTHGHPDRYDTAIFTSRKSVDQKIRFLNDPSRLAAGTPHPPGRPYRRQDGEIRWAT